MGGTFRSTALLAAQMVRDTFLNVCDPPRATRAIRSWTTLTTSTTRRDEELYCYAASLYAAHTARPESKRDRV